MFSLTIGSATAILVITEFVLTLLLTATTSIVINLRAHRKLYSTGRLDFSEIAWTVRSFFHPRLLLVRPHLFFLKVLRVAGPCLLLVIFVFIGASIEQKIDFDSYEQKTVKVHDQSSYWDTVGGNRAATQYWIEKALSKGEWKGLPSDSYVPVSDVDFNRLKWNEQPGLYTHKCRLDKKTTGEYALSLFEQKIPLWDKTYPHIRSAERARTVGDLQFTKGWFSMRHHVSAAKITHSKLSVNESEALYSSSATQVNRSAFPYVASRAAFRLYYEKKQDRFQYHPRADANYIDLLNNPSTNSSTVTCKKLSRANVIVEFIGIKKGRRVMIQEPAPKYNRVDMTRGTGIYQRFICRRRRRRTGKVSKKCVVFPLLSSSLAAGVAARRNTVSISGDIENDNATINEEAQSATGSELAEEMHPMLVEEALDLGNFVLLAGNFASRRRATVRLARELVTFDWRTYTITLAVTLALCALLFAIELSTRIRLGTLRLGVDAPLDPVHMAQVCGVSMPQSNPVKKLQTPRDERGYGIRIILPQGRNAICDSYWEVGPWGKKDENFDDKV